MSEKARGQRWDLAMSVEERRDEILDRQPIRRIGQPAEIAEVALLLASDRGSYMTGQTVVVDGGFLTPAL